jgi:flagellar biosynthesis protein FliQ
VVEAAELVVLGQEALFLSVVLVLPILAAAALVTLASAVLQSATQAQDPTLSHLPRLIAVVLVVGLTGPWIGSQVLAFTQRAFGAG